MDIVSHQKIRRFEAGTFQEIESSVATEYPLTIYVNDQELVTIVCTPEYLEDLVVGFLTSEGIVRGPQDIDSVDIIEATGHAKVSANFVEQIQCQVSRQALHYLVLRQVSGKLLLPIRRLTRQCEAKWKSTTNNRHDFPLNGKF